MAREFELNFTRFQAALAMAPNAAMRGAKRGLHDALDDWVRESRDIAPIDKGTLRRGIKADGVRQVNGKLEATISSQAIEGDFNYAYYIHEEDAGGKNVSGEKKYLDKSAEENRNKWLGWVEDEIKTELRRGGW